MYKFKCKKCGISFQHKNKNAKYCSQVCCKADSQRGIIKQCFFCGKDAYAARYKLKKSMFFCSFDCNMAWQRSRRPTRICSYCGIAFKKKAKPNAKWCSSECRNNCPENIHQLASMRKKQAGNKINKLEKLGYNLLDELGVKYEQQYILDRYVVDAFLPKYKIIVQFDGDYWHGHPDKFPVLSERQSRQKEIDRLQSEVGLKLGFVTFRIWECDMHLNYKSVKNNLQTFLKEHSHVS